MNEPAPTGETGTELSGGSALAVIGEAFRSLARGAPKLRISPCAIDVDRDGRWIIAVVRWKDGRSFTVKLTRAWAILLWQRLGKALGL